MPDVPKEVNKKDVHNDTDLKNRDLSRILDIEIPLSVVLSEKKMSLKEIIDLSTGFIIEFDKTINEPLDLYANNQIIANGITVKVGEKFALQVRQVGSLQQTIKSLGEKK